MFHGWNNRIFPHVSKARSCRDPPVDPVALRWFSHGQFAAGAGRVPLKPPSAGSEGPRKALRCPPDTERTAENCSAQQLRLSWVLHMPSHCSSKSSWQPEWRVFYPLSGNINMRFLSWPERFILDVLLSKKERFAWKFSFRSALH